MILNMEVSRTTPQGYYCYGKGEGVTGKDKRVSGVTRAGRVVLWEREGIRGH